MKVSTGGSTALTACALVTASCIAACSSSSSPASSGDDGGGTPQGALDGTVGNPRGGRDDASAGDGANDASSSASDAPGAADAGAIPQEAGSGTGPCAGAGIVLCDDFEQTQIDTGTWTKLVKQDDPGSKLALDTSKSKTGKQSLHCTISANAGQAMVSETRTFPATKLYGRAYLYFGSPVIPDHSSIMVAEGTSPFNASDRFGEQNAHWFMNFISDNNPSEMSIGGATAVATGAWQCVQWSFDGAAGSFSESIDGVMLDAKGNNATTFKAPPFSSFRIGMETYSGGPTSPVYDLWVDDVAIGTQPIDCLP